MPMCSRRCPSAQGAGSSYGVCSLRCSLFEACCPGSLCGLLIQHLAQLKLLQKPSARIHLLLKHLKHQNQFCLPEAAYSCFSFSCTGFSLSRSILDLRQKKWFRISASGSLQL